MNQDSDVGEAAPGIAQDQPYPLEDRLLGSLRRRQHLAGQPLFALLQNNIRKRAADIDGNPQIACHLCSRPCPEPARP